MRLFPILAVPGVIGFALANPVSRGPSTHFSALGSERVEQVDFEWKGQVEAGLAIEIKNVNGSVRAVAGSGNEVEVTGTKSAGRRGDPDDVTFEVVEHGDGVTVCAVYPSRRGRPNLCRPGSHGRMNVRDNDTKVHFTVRVPPRVNFIGRSVNGNVDAESLGGNVVARTVNGNVDVWTSGYAEATTVNGSILASLGRGDWMGELEFSTVNGTITIDLPADVGAEVTAKTINGSIDTEFPLTVRGRFTSKRITATIGGGGRGLRLETVNGSIRLRKGR